VDGRSCGQPLAETAYGSVILTGITSGGRRPRTQIWLATLGITLLLAIMVSACIGSYAVPPLTTLRILAALGMPWPLPNHPSWTVEELVVVQSIRLPRIFVAVCAGAGLGLSGATLQGLFRNPLVTPDLIGLSAGAACGGALAILISLSQLAGLAGGMAGGVLALLLAVGLTRISRTTGKLGLILAGVIVAAFSASIVMLIEYLANPFTALPAIVFWLMGSFAAADPQKAIVMAVALLAAGGPLILLRWRVNLLSLGDEDAVGLGVRVPQLRWILLSLVSLIVAAQVSVSGAIGWVGLIVPHCARMLVGNDHRRLLPVSGLIGGIFMLVMDDLARSVAGQELPIGLLTALIGAPAFAFLFWGTHARGLTV
jgi:iron complex transport system permease protein